MLFFSKHISAFNKSFANLLQLDTEENTEEKEDEGSGNDKGENAGIGEDYYGWLSVVDKVSETVRESWDDVLKMNIYTFFNIWGYRNDKDKRTEELIKAWKNKH